MHSILSTKKLSTAQKQLALGGKLRLVEYDAIEVNPIPFQIADQFDCYVFTSQNAVQSFITNKTTSKANDAGLGLKALCVGEKTKTLLEEHGFDVLAAATNADALGNLILKEYKTLSFVFLCGNRSLKSLGNKLKSNHIQYHEVVVYRTALKPKRFDRHFDAVLFYSPSGVQSFVAHNELSKSTAICIGPTTLSEAKRHTDYLIQANKQTIENVIVQAVKFAAKVA